MLGDLYYGTLHNAGITTLARRLRRGALVLCYHNVVPRSPNLPAFGDPGLHLPLEQFTAQVHWLRDHYTVVPLRVLLARLETGDSVRGLVAITFDDGYSGAFTFAWPVLRNLGLPAIMFIVAGAAGRPAPFWWDHPAVDHRDRPAARDRLLLALGGDRDLVLKDAGTAVVPPPDIPATHLPADWSVISQAAADGLDLGAHSVTHRTLTRLDAAELAREVEKPSDLIEAHTGVRPDLFSYPYGIWDARVRDAVRRAGYRGAATLDYGLNSAGTDACQLRRINVPAAISSRAFAAWAAGMRPRRAPLGRPAA
jgi:peptidoglycan/xylan/chitin deacetylase (PgdA/CDA1 family)